MPASSSGEKSAADSVVSLTASDVLTVAGLGELSVAGIVSVVCFCSLFGGSFARFDSPAGIGGDSGGNPVWLAR